MQIVGIEPISMGGGGAWVKAEVGRRKGKNCTGHLDQCRGQRGEHAGVSATREEGLAAPEGLKLRSVLSVPCGEDDNLNSSRHYKPTTA